jgi:hypothetical protein
MTVSLSHIITKEEPNVKKLTSRHFLCTKCKRRIWSTRNREFLDLFLVPEICFHKKSFIWDLRSSVMWRRVDWYLLPTFRYNLSVQWSSGPQNIDDLTTNLVSITSQKSGDLMYIATKVCYHAKLYVYPSGKYYPLFMNKQMHNLSTIYYTALYYTVPTCFDAIVSSLVSS